MHNFIFYYKKFEKLQGFIINDLKNSTIKAHANFLVAMGIFNYIELLGSFYESDETRGYATRRFEFAIKNLFPGDYFHIYQDFDTFTDSNPYDVLRNGSS